MAELILLNRRFGRTVITDPSEFWLLADADFFLCDLSPTFGMHRFSTAVDAFGIGADSVEGKAHSPQLAQRLVRYVSVWTICNQFFFFVKYELRLNASV